MLLELLVAAAASVRPALDALRPAMAVAAGEAVVVRYGATGSFARQIENGAPFDLFFAADEMTPRGLLARRLLTPDSFRIYAEGRLVLVVDSRARLDVPPVVDARWLAALPSLAFRRLVIASPKVAPYGRAAKEALTRAGAWNALFPRVVTAASVEEALAYVRSGNAEIGFVAGSIADVPGLRRAPVDPRLHARILHAGGVVSASRQRAAALRALDAATGAPARAAWERAGFTVPDLAVRPAAGSSRGADRSPPR